MKLFRRSYSAKKRRIRTVGLILIVCLTLGMLYLMWDYNQKRAQNTQHYMEMDESLYVKTFFDAEEDGDFESNQPFDASRNVYEKMQGHQDINLLFLGNEVGRTNAQWILDSVANLETRYDLDVKGGNYAQEKTDMYYGYHMLNSYSRGLQYDMLILLYGATEDPKDFFYYYDGLMYSIRQQNPRCEIICVIEASRDGYNENADTIRTLCEHYDAVCLDMQDYFHHAKANYDLLTTNGVALTEAGGELYQEAFLELVGNHYHGGRTVTMVTTPYTDEAFVFGSFQYVILDRMTKVSDTVYTYKTNAKLASVIYYDASNGGDVLVSVNGKSALNLRNLIPGKTAKPKATVFANHLTGENTIRIEIMNMDNIRNIKGISLCGVEDE